MVRWIHKSLLAGIGIATVAAILTACWDKVEMNELAIVSMIGVDIDPDNGQMTIYYQIINPLSGTSARGTPGGEQAPVYTYKAIGSSFGEIQSTVYKQLPRRLFNAHYEALIVSRRAATHGVRDILNYIEMQPTGRSAVPMVIADSPLDEVMETFTPLERVPAESVDSRLRLLTRNSLLAGKHGDVNDIIERMERGSVAVVPMIRAVGGNPKTDSGKITADIRAYRHNLIIGGGAVLRDYRMVGQLEDEHLIWYHLLDGGRGRHVRRYRIGGKTVTMETDLTRLERKVRWSGNRPVVTIALDLQMSAQYASEFVPRNQAEVERLEQDMNRNIADELSQFYRESQARGWDLLRIGDILARHPSPQGVPASEAVEDAEVAFRVHTRLMFTGSMNEPYGGRTGWGSRS